MPRLTVTDRAYEIILRYARNELGGTVWRQRDGRWEVEISEALQASLIDVHFEGEPVSQTIIRVLPTWAGGRR